jgi:hypothetical protein
MGKYNIKNIILSNLLIKSILHKKELFYKIINKENFINGE